MQHLSSFLTELGCYFSVLGESKGARDSSLVDAMEAMSGHGDYSLLISGLYENIHQVASFETQASHILPRFALSAEWFSLSNIYQSQSYLSPNGMILEGYIPLVGAAVHFAHAITAPVSSTGGLGGSVGNKKSKIEWPKKVSVF